MNATDMNRFELRISLKADKQRIYNCWSTQGGLENWFLRSAVFSADNGIKRNRDEVVQKTDSYEWKWLGYPDSMMERGKVTQANGTDFFQFSFSGNSLVSVHLKTEKNGTMLELIQENIPFEEDPRHSLYILCQTGWTFYLANLKSLLEGGIDLRNKDENIPGVINA